MVNPETSTPIEPEAELVGPEDQSEPRLPPDQYKDDDETGEDQAEKNRREDPPV